MDDFDTTATVRVDGRAFAADVASMRATLEGSLGDAAEVAVHFQVGEPWWWVRSDRTICLYDAAAVTALAAMGTPAVPIADLGLNPTKPQRNMLIAAGTLLAQSTAALIAAVDDEAAGSVTSYGPLLSARMQGQAATVSMCRERCPLPPSPLPILRQGGGTGHG